MIKFKLFLFCFEPHTDGLQRYLIPRLPSIAYDTLALPMVFCLLKPLKCRKV